MSIHQSHFSTAATQVLIWFITFAEQYSPRPLVLIIIQTWLKYNQFLAIRGDLLGNCSTRKRCTLIFMILHGEILKKMVCDTTYHHSICAMNPLKQKSTLCLCHCQITSWWTIAPASERVPATRWKWRRTASKCASRVPTSALKVNRGMSLGILLFNMHY